MNSRQMLSSAAVATGAVLLSMGVQVLAYTAPTVAPPGGDAWAPLNTGTAAQSKSAPLTVNASPSSAPVGLLVGKDLKTFGNIKVIDGSGLDYAVVSPKYCFGTSGAADITRTNCITAWPTGGGGGITSLTQSTGITLTPNPITTTGTIAADTAYVQRRVSGTCTVGSAITAINADGTVVCSKKMQAGVESGESTTHNVSFSPAFSDATYALTVVNQTVTGDCFNISVTSKTASGFTFQTPDACNAVTYNWIALDY